MATLCEAAARERGGAAGVVVAEGVDRGRVAGPVADVAAGKATVEHYKEVGSSVAVVFPELVAGLCRKLVVGSCRRLEVCLALEAQSRVRPGQ